MKKKEPVLLERHKLNGAKKAKRAKLIKPVPTPTLKWGEKK